MRIQKYTVRGFDAFGKPVIEEIKVPRYNLVERAFRRLRRLFRRPRVVTGVRVDELIPGG